MHHRLIMEMTLDEALQKAVDAHKAGQIQEADRLYTAIIKAQPKNPNANHNMGVLTIGVGKIQEALDYFKTALEANPNEGQYWLSYIDALIKLDRIADAQAVFDLAKDKGAKSEAFDRLEQKLAEQMPAFDKANSRAVESLSSSDPNILDTIKLDKALRLAKKKSKEGQLKEAKSIYKDILQNFPKHKQSLNALQALAGGATVKAQDPPSDQLQTIINIFTQGQLQQALSDATEMLEKFPNSAVLYNIAGASNAGLMQFSAAIDNYKAALKINPDNADVYNNLGIALNVMGDLESAIVNYKQALKINPGNADVYNNMGIAFNEMGDIEAAIDSYKQLLKVDPNHAEAHSNMGNALKNKGDLQAALDSYKQALKINPNNADAYNNMGTALKDKGDLGAAIESYKQALKIKPDHAEVYYNLGVTLNVKGDLDAAIASYKQALKIKPDYADAHLNLGSTFKGLGKYKDAIYHFDFLSNQNAKSQVLECLYITKNYSEYDKRLHSISALDDTNIRVAAVSAFAAHQMKKKDPYQFCKNPLDFLLTKNLSEYDAHFSVFLNDIMKESDGYPLVWESRTTKFGFQGTGNLFENPSKNILYLKNIIQQAVNDYYDKFKFESNVLIESWPKNYKLIGWYNRLLKNGYQTAHIHANGWISGVIYLKTIEPSINDEGAIEFGLHGYDLPITDNDYPRQLYRPKSGDIVLFPSSLFHRTIPFTTNSERHVIVFDLNPI